ncbi:MAG: NAD(P)H-dependent oxidoreductase [Solirubrobacterales bacterium]
MPKLLIIIVSVRDGRAGQPVADWFIERAKAHGKFDVEVADLKEIALPLIDEPHHPRLQQYQYDHTKAWSKTVSAADAFVFVTPEYNFTTPPSLINALDYLSNEWKHKAAGFVSYGGISAGTRSTNEARIPLSCLGVLISQSAVNISFFTKQIVDGQFQNNELNDGAADAMLDELVRLDGALRTLRV